MNDVKKLSVLDFKKEQLVNLNEEEMFKVKGGTSSIPCVRLGLAFGAAAYGFGVAESYWHCIGDGGGNEEYFTPTQIQFPEVTCASVDWVYIYGY